MTDLRRAAEQALKRLDMYFVEHGNDDDFAATQALRQALAEPEPWVKTYAGGKPNYCTPEVTPEEWDGPTDEEYENFCSLIQREEAKLKEKNGG